MSISDGRNVRHNKCGARYNGYRWERCPFCKADEMGLVALGCASCGTSFFTAEREDLCSECGSGETVFIAAPEGGQR